MKRIIEIQINTTDEIRGWGSLPIIRYHASSTEDAARFADAIASYNKAQVRWNWLGSTDGHYTNAYGQVLAHV